MNIDDLRVAFRHPNVKAFYMVVRRGESSLDYSAYSMVNGRPPITDFSKHPYAGLKTTEGGRAAGASQFIPSTWGELADRYGFTSFTPEEQDLGYVGCLVKRNALDDVIAGRFDQAVAKCRLEWTSLPGAAENNPSWNMEKARALYAEYGGTFSDGTQPAAPIEDKSTAAQPKESAMGPAVFLPAILQMIPQLVGVFGKGGRAEQNQKAIQTVVDSFTAAIPGAVNTQDALEKAEANPSLKAAATTAVLTHPVVEQLLEIGPTQIKDARAANLAAMQAADKWWKVLLNPVLLVTAMTLPLVYIIIIRLVEFISIVSSDVIAQTIGTVIGLVLGGVMGFWMGQTYQQTNRRSQDQPTDLGK